MKDQYSTPQSNTASSLQQISFLDSYRELSGKPILWAAFEPRRFDSQTPLSKFLEKLLRDQELTIRDACKIAGISPSVLHGWLSGSYPIDTVIHLKKLSNYFGYSLAEALTGSPDEIRRRF